MIDKNKIYAEPSRSIPKNWEVVKLGEVCEILDGKRKPINATERDKRIVGKEKSELFPYFGSTGQVGWIDNFLLDGEFVLLGEDAAPFLQPLEAKAYLVHGKVWVNNHAHILKSFFSNKFLCHYLNQISYREFVTGTTRLKLNQSAMKEISVVVPPLPEQHRIVSKIEELFAELDKGIEILKTTQQQLKVYRQAVLKWAFEGKLTNEKNIRWGTLKEVIEGVEYGSASKSQKQGKVPVLRMGNIQNGRFEWDDLVYTSDEEEIEKYLLKKDDVLFNRTNSPEWVGKTAIYRGEQKAIFAGYLIRINRKEKELDANYLNYFLNSQMAKNHGNKVKSFGVNQSNINGTKLKAYPFPITSLPSQKKIIQEVESRLSVCDKMEETIENALQQAEALRLSILKKAFEGKLVEQNPKDEPAAKLLERIRKMSESGLAGLKDNQDTRKKTKKA